MSLNSWKRVRALCAWLVRNFGQKIIDQRTGDTLGKAFLFCWKGRIHLLGYDGKTPLRPVFIKDSQIRYWRQSIGFESHETPDFPRKLPENSSTQEKV